MKDNMVDNGIIGFYDVMVNEDGRPVLVHRFPASERGQVRAEEYAARYNVDMLKSMGLKVSELGLGIPDFFGRPQEYVRALLVETYRTHAARVRGTARVPVVGDDDPLPADYPHPF